MLFVHTDQKTVCLTNYPFDRALPTDPSPVNLDSQTSQDTLFCSAGLSIVGSLDGLTQRISKGQTNEHESTSTLRESSKLTGESWQQFDRLN